MTIKVRIHLNCVFSTLFEERSVSGIIEVGSDCVTLDRREADENEEKRGDFRVVVDDEFVPHPSDNDEKLRPRR